ncbi:hypothetical protein Q5530_03740 [Saccharothrix sp. BKS2]|uniref:hypothetical protein n=1 Tax=Saccharothrix sp. BKS2 TaxID=3064400 RepID=UPI0039ECB43C
MRRKKILLPAAIALLASLAPVPVAAAEPAPDRAPAAPAAPVEPPAVAAERRGELLGADWKASGDRLWTTSGDANGFHVLVAEARTGYSWRTAATLRKPGLEADAWVGNACVTGSGTRAVVVYAPRAFTNDEKLFARGGFSAVVDLVSGAVTDLPVRTTLAYYNPGCGLGEEVALTQAGDTDLVKTGLRTVDAATGRLSGRTELDGQLTSAVPLRDGFAVAGGTGVLHVGRDGKKQRIAKNAGVPFNLRADRDGGVVFMAAEDGETVNVQRSTGVRGKISLLARGAVGRVDLTTASSGRVFITGEARLEGLPPVVTALDVPAGSSVSTAAEAVITGLTPAKTSREALSQPWNVRARSLKTGREMGFGVDPANALTPREVDPGYTCAIPRNDVQRQVLQPKPKQVEWAVDMAVKGHLDVHRPAGWGGHPGGYRPQTMFPPLPMANANGGQVPAQVMLGITGQESNLWQAARFVLPGETGNPLIGNYYGQELYDTNEGNDWDIDFSHADCGYGVTQMTDGMRKPGAGNALPYDQQLAIATDYAANTAAGLRKLQEKWNELQAAGMTLNNNDPDMIENWFFSAWSYNSGFKPQGGDPTGAWGLGWTNNPANPNYDPDRKPFGEDPRDFAHPQDWPYPEKVLGFAANPPSGWEDPYTEVPFFLYGLWPGGVGGIDEPGSAAYNKHRVKPDRHLFCTAANDCVPGGRFTPTDPAVDDDPERDTGPCAHKNGAGQYDLKCWWHASAAWKPNCNTCGVEYTRYDYPLNSAEPANGGSWPPYCPQDVELPHSTRSLVVDHDAPTRRPECANRVPSDGVMSFRYDKPGAWVDLHQLGTGFNGHSWISHTKQNTPAELKAVATVDWTLGKKLRTRAGVWAYIPMHASAKTTAAVYELETALGRQTVTKNQRDYRGRWMPLGNFDFDNIPKVTLSTLTGDGASGNVVAFDALMFAPLTEYQQDDDYVIAGGFTHIASNRCPTASTLTYPAPVTLQECLGEFNEDWLVRLVPGTVNSRNAKEYRLVQRSTGLCMAARHDSATNKYVVEARQCGPDPKTDTSALWTATSLSGPDKDMNQPQSSAICSLHLPVPCIQPDGEGTAAGTPLVVKTWGSGTTPYFKW